MADVLTRENGFVTSASSDWALMETAVPLSLVFLFHGISASLLGKWQLKVGPRKAVAVASFCFGGGLMLGAAGIYLHNLPLLYLGYGALGGSSLGFACMNFLLINIISKYSNLVFLFYCLLLFF